MKQIAIKHVYGNVLRVDVPLTEKIYQVVDGQEVPPTERDFYPDADMPVTIALDSTYKHYTLNASLEGHIAHFEDKGTIKCGVYNVAVQCFKDGNPYRYMVRDVIKVVDATAEAGIEAGIEFDAETQVLEGAVFVSYVGEGGTSVQSDWDENNPASPSYIKHKPDLTIYVTQTELQAVEAQIPEIPSGIVTDENYVHTDNNYTDADKAKLAGLHNYDDTEVRNLIADNSVAVETKNAATAMTISADKLTVISGAVGNSTITLQVPNDNKAHVWDIMMTTGSSVAVTFAMSNGATILKPSSFSVAASKDVEISVIGVGTKYYLRYGEFAS